MPDFLWTGHSVPIILVDADFTSKQKLYKIHRTQVHWNKVKCGCINVVCQYCAAASFQFSTFYSHHFMVCLFKEQTLFKFSDLNFAKNCEKYKDLKMEK